MSEGILLGPGATLRAGSAIENDLAEKLVAWHNEYEARRGCGYSMLTYFPVEGGDVVFAYFYREGCDSMAVLALDQAAYNDSAMQATTFAEGICPRINLREHVRGAWWQPGSPWSKSSCH